MLTTIFYNEFYCLLQLRITLVTKFPFSQHTHFLFISIYICPTFSSIVTSIPLMDQRWLLVTTSNFLYEIPSVQQSASYINLNYVVIQTTCMLHKQTSLHSISMMQWVSTLMIWCPCSDQAEHVRKQVKHFAVRNHIFPSLFVYNHTW